jgi:hypothetical protein
MKKQVFSLMTGVCLLLVPCYLKAKILIVTHNYNRPEFVSIQLQCFNKFLKDPFDYVVFNDALDKKMVDAIDKACKSLGVPCIKVDQDKRPPQPPVKNELVSWVSIRHAQVLRYSMDVLAAEHDDIVVFIDNDMFLLKNFSFRSFLGSADISGLKQKRGNFEYIWPNLLILNMPRLPHKDMLCFFPLTIGDIVLDTGGSLYTYLLDNPTIKVLYFPQEGRFCFDSYLNPFNIVNSHDAYVTVEVRCQSCALRNVRCNHIEAILKERGFDERIIRHVKQKTLPCDCEFVLGDTFFHYRRGSWANKTGKQKFKTFLAFIKDLMAD